MWFRDTSAEGAILNRTFSVDRAGIISLKALPRTESAAADAVLMLIYGYQKLQGEDRLTSSAILAAAKQSGLQIERVDYALGDYEGQFVITSGFRRGKRYGLNNRGINRAEELIGELFA